MIVSFFQTAHEKNAISPPPPGPKKLQFPPPGPKKVAISSSRLPKKIAISPPGPKKMLQFPLSPAASIRIPLLLGKLFPPHMAAPKRCRKTVLSNNRSESMKRPNVHLRYFLIFSIIKNEFLGIFYQVDNLFLHQSYLKSPLPVKLTWYKMQKWFFIIEKIQKYRKCPAQLEML